MNRVDGMDMTGAVSRKGFMNQADSLQEGRAVSGRKPIRRIFPGLMAALAVFLLAGQSFGEETEEGGSQKAEPEISYESDIQTIHVGESHVWVPFVNEPELEVTYGSSDPGILTIREDGTLVPHREGDVLISASTAETPEYQEDSYEIYLYVLPGEDGLYLNDLEPHFYWQGKKYKPGELPLETERTLCLTQPDLKVFLEDYLKPWQDRVPDPDEAALTAILNYGAEYFSKKVSFDGYVSNAEAGKTDWMVLLDRKVGFCSYNASMFCYLMYLSGLPCIQMDSPLTEERAHSWNLVGHDGYYYNLEEYDFLHMPRPHYAAPPLTKETAGYFPKKIVSEYYLHFPVEGSSFTPGLRIEDMGQDLSKACPVLLYEKTEDGTYRVWFDTVRKGEIPAFSDGTVLRLEDMTYKNMETDEDGQPNEEAMALFQTADEMLWDEIRDLFAPAKE